MKQNQIREQILKEVNPYLDFVQHKDLIAFCVDGECFENWDNLEENHSCAVVDFNELIVVVEKDWLIDHMQHDGIKNPLVYLQEEYTSDDSYEWFIEANNSGKVVLVGFN